VPCRICGKKGASTNIALSFTFAAIGTQQHEAPVPRSKIGKKEEEEEREKEREEVEKVDGVGARKLETTDGAPRMTTGEIPLESIPLGRTIATTPMMTAPAETSS
jgi:hypothetical protein